MTAPANSTNRRILLARFSAHDGAEAAIARLKSAGVRLGNVAHIEKNPDGAVKFSESQDWGIGKSAVIGAVAAAIIPGIGIFMGAAAGAIAAYFIDMGFPDTLLQQTGSGLLSANESALVALVQSDDMTNAERVIGEAGGSVIGSGLEEDLARALESARGTAGSADTTGTTGSTH